MKEQLKEFQVRLDKLSKEFSEMLSEEKTEKKVLTDEDEEGWYIDDKLSCIGLHKHGQIGHCGIDLLEFYKDKKYMYIGCNGIWRKATNEEVIKIFTEYFRKQGFVSGKTKFKSVYSGDEFLYIEPVSLVGNSIGANSGIVFSSTKFTIATPIKDTPIMFYGSEVEFKNNMALINNVYFDKNGIKALLPANPEVFQPILDQLERPH